MRIVAAISLVTVTSLVGCSQAPTITVVNKSPITISNVTVTGSGFSERINRLGVGEEHRLRVRPTGESGVRVAFDAGAIHVDSGEQDYIEPAGGYQVTVTVDTNLGVTLTSDLPRY